MNRKRLFRGKRLDNGEWVYGNLIQMDEGGSQSFIFPFYKYASSLACNQIVSMFMVAVDPTTVGQFTGFCDKHGVRIFEGDIVDIWSAGQHCHGLVKWGQGSVSFFVEVPCTPHIWHLSGGGKNYDEETCEVIGNIHDNPELLKEESK